MRRKLVSAVLAVGAVVWLVVPAVSMWWLTRSAAHSALTMDTVTFVPVQQNEDPTVSDVDVVLSRAAVPQVVAPTLSGLVEEVDIASGESIADGAAVLVAGGIRRLAYASGRPFGRALRYGDVGPDVQALNHMLGDLGYEHGNAGVAVGSTVRGVASLAQAIGAGYREVFDPGWVVYLPAPDLVVDSVELTVGAPVPGPGAVIATGQAPLLSGLLVPPGTVAAPTDAAGTDAGGAGSGGPPLVDEETPTVVAPPDAVLTVDAVPIALGDPRSELSADGLAAIASIVSADDAVLSAQLSIPPVDGQYVVPPAALFADSDGRSCVLRRRGGNEAGHVVRTVGSSYDRTVITGDLVDGDEIALSPPAALRTCA